uniref:Uncharacterized protein n=1 Tax=Bursaphelenchus xylophilus TaxID=6326 RepID=A0A1I7SRA9_BURXY
MIIWDECCHFLIISSKPSEIYVRSL